MPRGACPYEAVGMHRASHSAIGLPSSSTSASLMVGFLIPADVRNSLMQPPWRNRDPYAVGTGRSPRNHRRAVPTIIGRSNFGAFGTSPWRTSSTVKIDASIAASVLRLGLQPTRLQNGL